MKKRERAMRLRVAYEIIDRVFSDLSRGTRDERDLALEFSEPLRLLVLLTDKVEKGPKSEILKQYKESQARRRTPPAPRYTRYDQELERYVVPCLYKAEGGQITFHIKSGGIEEINGYAFPEPDIVFGEVIDRLAYYENQEENEA